MYLEEVVEGLGALALAIQRIDRIAKVVDVLRVHRHGWELQRGGQANRERVSEQARERDRRIRACARAGDTYDFEQHLADAEAWKVLDGLLELDEEVLVNAADDVDVGEDGHHHVGLHLDDALANGHQVGLHSEPAIV